MDCWFPFLHVVTDTRPGRDPLRVVRAAVGAAARQGFAAALAVQVRVEDDFTDRQAYELVCGVLALCRPAGVLCLVNDRLHVALAAGADGGHVGADDLPVAAARRVLSAGRSAVDTAGPGGRAAVLGATCREPVAARAAVAAGATYLGVGPAYATVTKDGLPAPIGPAGVQAVARAVPATPVIAIGGVTMRSAPALLAAGAYGVAVVTALSAVAEPQDAVTALLSTLRRGARDAGAASAATTP